MSTEKLRTREIEAPEEPVSVESPRNVIFAIYL